MQQPQSATKMTNHILDARKNQQSAAAADTFPPLPEVRRTNSCIESKSSKSNICVVSSERLQQLKKNVENAVKEHRTFTIKGGFQAVRNALLQRGWVEKFEPKVKKPSSADRNPPNTEDITNNLPAKLDGESQSAHIIKCEKMIMSRLLYSTDVDIYWSLKRDPSDYCHRLSKNQIMNRFNRSLYSSKEGLCLLLQQMHWHNEPGVSFVRFPRCYVLGFSEHYHTFVDDFRMTACISLLKWFITAYHDRKEKGLVSCEGVVPIQAIKFSVDRINDYVACQKHIDIDREINRTMDHDWDQFLTNFSLAVHHDNKILEQKEIPLSMMDCSAKAALAEIARYWPQIDLDGTRNIWILKPGNKCRGRGITLVKNIDDVTKIVQQKLKYVVQKYIEKPLLIYKTKFDIRQWFMVTSTQPLIIWMYRDCYLRFSSQIFNLNNFHESLHLTNHAVQHKYTNNENRDKSLPDHNMWDSNTFKQYLKGIGQGNKWNEVIYPGMREGIVGSMLACQETMDRRPLTFELYGADFILAEDFTPWLLEINSSPDLSSSTAVTARMCPQVLEDVIKVIVDKRKDLNSNTGLFDVIYKQAIPRAPAYLGMNLAVRGRKVFKRRSHKFSSLDDQEPKSENKENSSFGKSVNSPQLKNSMKSNLGSPKSKDFSNYQGPIIGDLIEELHKTYFQNTEYSASNSNNNGISFAVPVKPTDSKKKSDLKNQNNQGVSKRECLINKRHINKSVSLNRNGNSLKETGKKVEKIIKQKSKSFLGVGVLKEWKQKSKKMIIKNNTKSGSGDEMWEKETASILKGKTILSKSNFNKTYIRNNKLSNSCESLPQLNLNASCKINNYIKPDLLTVGLRLKTGKTRRTIC